MPKGRTLSSIERELQEKIHLIVDHATQDALTRRLRELLLRMKNPDHDSHDLMACSGIILDLMESSDGLYSRSEDYIGLVGLLNEARHQWAARHVGSSTQKTNQKSSTLAYSPRDNSDHDGTPISYPISAATYRLLQDSQFLYRLANMPEITPNAYQSIISLMKSSSLDDQRTQPSEGGQDIIEEILKNAYWDQMKEALELEDPKAHIDQLKILYKDLADTGTRGSIK
ncbi:hypothetical protein RhiJN_10664 [Ceratobasidium sp. AG-Ba]|nr:hypothetical protein RhiJN_10664 [Ceratobasidium sp. AG-Ba]